MYHYTYRITNTKINKHYYGARSCKCHPKEDLGIKYFSSSYDKEFMENQKTNPNDFKYKVISLFEYKKDSLELEIKLHNRFDVGRNENFYNRAKQTSTGFDITGIKLGKRSLEIRKKISEAQKGVSKPKDQIEKMRQTKIGSTHTEEHKRKIRESCKGMNKGIPKSEECKRKMSEAAKGRTFSKETLKKLSVRAKGIPKTKIECPHCGKIGGLPQMKQWHFDKCKLKVNKITL